ncbi:GGDEF domain-containing protein, partial [Alkalibacillus salilacus]
LANKDPLTGLANRRKLNEGLHKLLQQQVLMNQQIALLYLDLDEFKEINDTYGHHVGDELLRQVTERINQVIRGDDTFSRIGGDEFVILLPDVDDMEEVAQIAERILEAVGQTRIIDGYSFSTSFSIGIAFYEEGDNPTSLIEKADYALYQAKDSGKNNYVIYNES